MEETKSSLKWSEIYITIKMDSSMSFDKDYLDFKFYIITYELDYLHNYTDWIEKECFYDGNRIVDNVISQKRNNIRSKGSIKTAEMLWICNGDKEKRALILLMMHVWQVLDNYPNCWSKDVKSIYMELIKIMFKRMKDLNMNWWNGNVSKTMPFSLLLKEPLHSIMEPRNIEEVLEIFSLEVNYIFNKYQLIKCIDPTSEERIRKDLEKIRNLNLFK